ncbi:hypothetical protein [Lysinibacillus sp. G4S2]|uniref:hypothetical protein n=1 Tax=Lysinibacillus sp. G4S2 TaxID=3055859 RepID=UPI0025A13F11|nr:hypothetical protein [Lysinibacillus sp. G4S2]MDM5246283.1 hypothetical protein [Lysinibacillus sp. G4S2]
MATDLRNRIVYKNQTVDYDTLIQMKFAQLAGLEKLKAKDSDVDSIGKAIAGFTLTVLALVFFTKVGVSSGISSLVLSMASLGSASVISNTQNGYNRLSTAGDYMYRFGASKVTMEVAYLEYYDAANQTVIAVIQDVLAKSYTMPDGSVIKP